MENKRILFTSPGVAEYLDAPYIKPEPGMVTVQLAVSTISSGTERANLIGDVNINSTKPALKEAKFPRSGGYSAAGTVVEVGEGVENYRVGDRVAVFWGYHGRFVTVPTRNLFKLPPEIPFEEAAIWNIATFPMAAIRKCRLELGESAMVMGLGVLGLIAVKLLRAAGAMPIIAVDPVSHKREQALALGADYALDPMSADFAETAKALTGGGVKVCIEVTGKGAGLDGALDCMRRAGRVALLGCTRDSDFTIDYYRKVHGPGITLIGAHTQARPGQDSAPGWWTEQDDRQTLCDLYRFGRLSLAAMVEQTHKPEEAPEVYHRLATERTFPLVQFDWR